MEVMWWVVLPLVNFLTLTLAIHHDWIYQLDSPSFLLYLMAHSRLSMSGPTTNTDHRPLSTSPLVETAIARLSNKKRSLANQQYFTALAMDLVFKDY